MSDNKSLICLENLTKVYQTSSVETTALNAINIDVKVGEFVAIMGPSGCGKSTLLNIIGMLDNPTEGAYFFLDEDVSSYRESRLADIRKRNIGFIFQSFNLIPDLNLFDNVDVPLRYRGLPASDRKQRIENALEIVGLASRMKHIPAQLSGGQQQRVAIARALAGEPRILLADEPTGNLDTAMAHQVLDLLEQIHADGTTIVMVTHDPDLANRAERNIHLIDGRVAAEEFVFTPRESIASMQANSGEQLAAQS